MLRHTTSIADRNGRRLLKRARRGVRNRATAGAVSAVPAGGPSPVLGSYRERSAGVDYRGKIEDWMPSIRQIRQEGWSGRGSERRWRVETGRKRTISVSRGNSGMYGSLVLPASVYVIECTGVRQFKEPKCRKHGVGTLAYSRERSEAHAISHHASTTTRGRQSRTEEYAAGRTT
jgi:hypothetical protein